MSETTKRKFNVYFSQINQTKYEVFANSYQDAEEIAKKEWIEDNAEPHLLEIEEIKP